ncbi:PHB depolymerase family esterase [Variovorax sp. J22R24]|uniref:PHB depolymerase family esterase n=1 Tax=Variovorax gracilis TaxID=3053502 RepID=UPI0025787F96|nr:PHB depolymerase family esterase [Variovorax sp. J22R24]MDM0109230.1 PHB depolymerase family esterase [Variovorax sp. J22R24]
MPTHGSAGTGSSRASTARTSRAADAGGLTQSITFEHHVGAAHVHVAGLSAEGPMAAARYPDVFAAVGVHAGLPGSIVPPTIQDADAAVHVSGRMPSARSAQEHSGKAAKRQSGKAAKRQSGNATPAQVYAAGAPGEALPNIGSRPTQETPDRAELARQLHRPRRC